MKALAKPRSGSLPYEIADVAQNIYKSGISFQAARKVLKHSFHVIQDRTDTNDTQKALAQMGIDVGASEIPHDVASRRRYKILEKLVNLG